MQESPSVNNILFPKFLDDFFINITVIIDLTRICSIFDRPAEPTAELLQSTGLREGLTQAMLAGKGQDTKTQEEAQKHRRGKAGPNFDYASKPLSP